MRILLAHNYYQQPGGEDQVVATEAGLLERHGHTVLRFHLRNDDVANMHPLALAGATLWNRSAYRELRALMARERPDVVHFHNTFPLMSPAAYYAARAQGVPVVQTLHNYRLLCPNALLFREGRVCEDCVGKLVPWPAVAHACYKSSRLASGVTAAMLTTHRLAGTWRRMVNVYIALSDFARAKFVEGGLPAGKIAVKPNFVDPDPGPGAGTGDFAMFAGRLTPEKGVRTLLEAWSRMSPRIPLKIVGDGPLAGEVASAAQTIPGVEWAGFQNHEQILAWMKQAAFLVVPSTWYEGFPMTVAEALACGLPVLASNIGSLGELIQPGRTGFLFRPGDAQDLALHAGRLIADNHTRTSMRREARSEYETRYTAAANYDMLLSIYQRALSGVECSGQVSPAP